jgi:hypothetical protein
MKQHLLGYRAPILICVGAAAVPPAIPGDT